MEQEPTIENVDSVIEGLLEELDSYAELWDEHPELQEQWYWVDMEARVSKDREAAKVHLEEFLKVLKGVKNKST